MSRLGRGLVWFWVAVSIWLSDRWAWTLPAVGGVIVGVALARIQRDHYTRRTKGLPPFELVSLLIILLTCTSFVYLYVVFLLFGGRRPEGAARLGLFLGFLLIALLLVGALALAVRKLRVPPWLSRVWDWLLAER